MDATWFANEIMRCIFKGMMVEQFNLGLKINQGFKIILIEILI